MYSAILFDLGDTLLDFEPLDTPDIIRRGAADSYERLQQAGIALPSLDRYRKGHVRAVKWALVKSQIARRDFSVYSLMRKRTARLGIDESDPLMLELGWHWYKHVVPYSSIEPDLIATLQLFRNAGIKIGIVSNTFIGGPLLDRHLQVMGLIDYLPVRIYSSETGYRKPDRRIFEIALKAMGTRADETLFVGDVVKNDIIGSRKLGMKNALKVPRSVAARHRVADHLIRRISDLIPIVLPPSQVAATRA